MKKAKLSVFTIILLVMIAILTVYYFLFFVPAQAELTLLRTDISVYDMEASVYEPYLSDTVSLDADIAALEAQLEDLRANGYVNDSTVSLVIGDAIQRYNVSLTSITLGEETTISNYRALPINVSLTGSFDDILTFMDAFENDTEGSYLVHAANMEINGNLCTSDIVIYLCTPAEDF